jgi:hypothetical protein
MGQCKKTIKQQYDNEIFSAKKHKRNSQPTNDTFRFARHTSQRFCFAQPKEPIFSTLYETISTTIYE